MPCSLLYLVPKILNIFALFIVFFDVPTLDHTFSCQIMHFMVSKEVHTIPMLHLWWNALFAFPFCIEQSKKRAFWGGYFACCFDCCKTWTCQCLTDLFVLVRYVLGHRVCSRFSALWNLFKSSNLSSDDLKSDDHLYSVWKNYSTVDFRSDTTCVAYFCRVLWIFFLF